MDEKKVKEILDKDVFNEKGGLYSLGWYLVWNVGNKTACLDEISRRMNLK
jgi:hypothetical protein